jgi:hypothetical protein
LVIRGNLVGYGTGFAFARPVGVKRIKMNLNVVYIGKRKFAACANAAFPSVEG